MKAYRTHATVEEPAELHLTGLPFRPGTRVEVVVLAEEEPPEQQPPDAEEVAVEASPYRAG